MSRVHVALLSLPVLAVLVAISCSRPRSDEPAVQVIPPPAPYVEPAARNAAAAASAPRPHEEPPSAEEVKAFERRGPK